MIENEHTPIRTSHDDNLLLEWSLVLSSASIAHRLERTSLGAALIVHTEDAARAQALLADYDAEEHRPRPAPPPPPPDYGFTPAALITAVALLAFHSVTGERVANSVWFLRGTARAERIVHGEIWRTVTALTLHADFAHVAANAVFCALFGTALCRALGPGVGLAILLAAGAGGNLLNAIFHGWAHSAVGASTALFGGLGALGALQLARRRRAETSWRAWAPLAAALALLAWLGTSPESDVIAHLLGFASGIALGGAASRLDRPPSVAIQIGLEILSVAVVVGCWLVAFSKG
jgi:membrane associated rhomboid family serine protease